MLKKQIVSKFLIDKDDWFLLDGYGWYINSNGYLVRNPKMVNGVYENIERYLHRLIMKAKENEIVDHINRNRLDNRKVNLRKVSRYQHALNKETKGNKTTGVRGVRKVGNRFRAYVNKNNKQIHLGYYDTLEEAYQVRKDYYDNCF